MSVEKLKEVAVAFSAATIMGLLIWAYVQIAGLIGWLLGG